MSMKKRQRILAIIGMMLVLFFSLILFDIQTNYAESNRLIQGTLQPTEILDDVVSLFSMVPTMVGQGPDEYEPNINPLTGEYFENPDIMDRRPIAVKITNFPRYTRPQRGLMSADVVYHYYTEMGKTRFVAIFYGNDGELVGPVRSGRFFDEHIVRMYDALLVFGRADARVLEYFYSMEPYFQKSLILENSNEAQNKCNDGKFVVFCRDTEKVWYNSVHVNTKALTADMDRRYIVNHKPDLSGMYFSDVPVEGNVAFGITVTYSGASSVRWDYHIEEEKYYRLEEIDEYDFETNSFSYDQLMDDLTEEPVTADNIVVLFVEYEYFAKQPEAESMIIDLYGEGNGYAYRNGMAVPVKWTRAEDASMMRITTLDGNPYPFKIGNTFFEIVNTNTDLSVIDGIHWHYQFYMPEVLQDEIRPDARATATPSVMPTMTETPTK